MTGRFRQVGPLVLALAFATGLLGAPAAVSSARAAAPDLTITSDARYDVQPAQKRVRVTVALQLTNHLKDTATKRFYFDQTFLAVLPGATGFKLTGGTGNATVTISKRTANATILRLNLGSRLFSGKSATWSLRFDLVDGGGTATRNLRIGDSLASFPVWAYASDSTPGSTVTVIFPAGYETTVEAGKIPAPTKDATGRTIYRTGRLSTPLTFFAYLVADRPGAYDERALTTTVGGVAVPLTIRAWTDDPAWSTRVGGLVAKALPALGEAIGLPWPRDDTLVVQEAVSRSTGGYAGLFDPAQGLVEVAYYADDQVVLHEAAHAWFNGSLLADRWANEAFASYYGAQAAKALEMPVTQTDLSATLLESKIPLNAWGPVGKETTGVEDYAYAASLVLADAIAERAGADGLQAVWADAAGRMGAYQPPEAARVGVAGAPWVPESLSGPPDWRALLDLLEADTPAAYDDLWRRWVARDDDLPLLDDRTQARDRYAEVLTAAGTWRLPRAIRDALRAWQFATATTLLTEADGVLTERDTIETAAGAAGLSVPATLRTDFEDEDGFGDAVDEAALESAAIARFSAAVSAEPKAPDLVTQLGLWGSTPDASIADARSAFAAGDLDASVAAADAARSVWTTAADVGQGRLVSAVALALAAGVALILLALTIRGRSRRRHSQAVFAASMSRPVSRMMARPMTPGEARGPGLGPGRGDSLVAADARGTGSGADPEATQPYATLAATPEVPPSGADPDERDVGAGSA